MPGINGFFEVLKNVKHRNPEPKFCPSCKGHNIYPVQKFGIFPIKYKCRDCGYEGTLVIELDSEEAEEMKSGT